MEFDRCFFKTPDGKTKAINLANLVTAGKNLLRSRGIPFDENSKEGARLALTTFLADMQLAAPGYDIVIGNSNASIFDVNLSAGRLEDQIDTQVVAAVIDGSPVTLGQLFTSDFKQSADRSELVLPETQEDTIDTNVNRSEDFHSNLFRGGTRREGVTVQLRMVELPLLEMMFHNLLVIHSVQNKHNMM